MSYVKGNVAQKIEEKKRESEAFKEAWDMSREEYRLIAEMTKLRKQAGMTQQQLAELTGNRQQAISRMEKHENMPSLRFFCNVLNSLGYELHIVRKK